MYSFIYRQPLFIFSIWFPSFKPKFQFHLYCFVFSFTPKLLLTVDWLNYPFWRLFSNCSCGCISYLGWRIRGLCRHSQLIVPISVRYRTPIVTRSAWLFHPWYFGRMIRHDSITLWGHLLVFLLAVNENSLNRTFLICLFYIITQYWIAHCLL